MTDESGGSEITAPDFTSFALDARNGSGIGGFAVIEPASANRKTLSVALYHVTPGETYVGHIHTGSDCAVPGAIAQNLSAAVGFSYVEAGVTKTEADAPPLEVASDYLRSGHYVDYHLSGAGGVAGVQVSCGFP
jgi:hypothetical protein